MKQETLYNNFTLSENNIMDRHFMIKITFQVCLGFFLGGGRD